MQGVTLWPLNDGTGAAAGGKGHEQVLRAVDSGAALTQKFLNPQCWRLRWGSRKGWTVLDMPRSPSPSSRPKV